MTVDIDDKVWNPWHGCHKCSEGCRNCYAYFLDRRYGRDTDEVAKNKSSFNLPVKKDRSGAYKLRPGDFVRVCMTSDFFIEEADAWRDEAWDFIRRRPDVTFSLLTKRAQRMERCLPPDWGDGWDQVTFAVSAENQQRVDERMPYLLDLPAKHRWISLKPFIGEVDLDRYLADGKVETVLAGGENYEGCRPLRREWVEKVHGQCAARGVRLIFGQTGNVYVKDGKELRNRSRAAQMEQALLERLHCPPVDVDAEVAAIRARQAARTAAAKRR